MIHKITRLIDGVLSSACFRIAGSFNAFECFFDYFSTNFLDSARQKLGSVGILGGRGLPVQDGPFKLFEGSECIVGHVLVGHVLVIVFGG